MNQHERVQPRDYVPIALAKLLAHPLLVWLVGSAAVALGVALTPFALTVLVLFGAPARIPHPGYGRLLVAA